jgi:hypothetical protein
MPISRIEPQPEIQGLGTDNSGVDLVNYEDSQS